VFIIVCVALGAFGKTEWLTTITYVSYVKLFVTFLKYFPQAIMNFRRKSTEGWSIHNVMLDLTGGLFSFAQMFVDAVRHGTWSGFTHNPAKLGLSVLSIVFDILFILQHYVFYRGSSKKKVAQDPLEVRFLLGHGDGDDLEAGGKSGGDGEGSGSPRGDGGDGAERGPGGEHGGLGLDADGRVFVHESRGPYEDDDAGADVDGRAPVAVDVGDLEEGAYERVEVVPSNVDTRHAVGPRSVRRGSSSSNDTSERSPLLG